MQKIKEFKMKNLAHLMHMIEVLRTEMRVCIEAIPRMCCSVDPIYLPIRIRAVCRKQGLGTSR